MKNIEGYLYLLIIIGWIIATIINKNKKKADSMGKTLSQPKPKKLLEELFGDILGQENTTPQPIRRKDVPKKTPQPFFMGETAMKSTNDGAKAEMLDNMATSTFHHIDMVEPVDDEWQRVDIKLEDTDDWQRAFVYSEIFDRKY